MSVGFTKQNLDDMAERHNFHPALKLALRWLVDDGRMPSHLTEIYNQFGDVAMEVAILSPQSPQTTIAVHKLVEAKDASIRAVIEERERHAESATS